MGIHCLTRWLREARVEQPQASPATDGGRSLFLAAAGLAVLEALILGVLAHPAFFVLLPVAVVLLVLGLRKPAIATPIAVPAARASDFRRDYEQLGLPAPQRWEADAVESLANDLTRRRTQIDVDNATRLRFQYVHDQRPAALRQAEANDARVAEASRQFGVPAVNDVSALHTLANAISTWQVERGRAAAARANCAEAQRRVDAMLGSINADLQPLGYPAASGHAEASGFVDDVVRREQEWNDARTEEQRGSQRIDTQLQPQHGRCQRDLATFFARYGLAADDEPGLQRLLDQLPEYREAVKAVSRTTLEMDHAQATLGEDASLATRDALDLEADLRDAQASAAMLDSIGRQIAAIEARIEQARRGSDLEAALAADLAAADELRDAREGGEALAAGWALGEFVRQRTRDVDRPRVFHRARELFARITQGRYELDVDGSDPPRFRARDTITGTGHALDELSSGTRLQLLLAVRVAFVEQQERGPMLPLILDETLGNSDEYRARAIIDATVQIASEGRQVLYLTAQHDEVRKWQSILAERPDVAFKLVDLADVRGLADWDRLPPADPAPWPMPIVPSPNGHDREEYARLLHVPGIDLSATEPGGLHLWHLIDDLPVLHRLLSLQIATWGQLRTLDAHGGIRILDDNPTILPCGQARAAAIATITDAWQVGRGKPVDRAVLEDSQAITPVFIERVVDLAATLDGDPVALIAALERGHLLRFHSSSRIRLQEFFVEHGYIDLTPPLTLDEVRARVLAGASDDLVAGHLTPEWINLTLSTLWRDTQDMASPLSS